MTAVLPADDWADAWSEYRRIFDQYGLDEDQAHGAALAAMHAPGPGQHRRTVDRICDALKEFTVRAGERGLDLRAAIAYAVTRLSAGEPLERHTWATQWFGTAAEDLGPDVCQRLAEHITRHAATQHSPTEEV